MIQVDLLKAIQFIVRGLKVYLKIFPIILLYAIEFFDNFDHLQKLYEALKLVYKLITIYEGNYFHH